MDQFYKPPLQRPDECKVLEDNYLNCLLQKALKDRVTTNKCVMDSIIWFHLECPKAAAMFDDKFEFKRKFREFFALQKSYLQHIEHDDERRRVKDEFNHIAYPEDILEKDGVK